MKKTASIFMLVIAVVLLVLALIKPDWAQSLAAGGGTDGASSATSNNAGKADSVGTTSVSVYTVQEVFPICFESNPFLFSVIDSGKVEHVTKRIGKNIILDDICMELHGGRIYGFKGKTEQARPCLCVQSAA